VISGRKPQKHPAVLGWALRILASLWLAPFASWSTLATWKFLSLINSGISVNSKEVLFDIKCTSTLHWLIHF
jgi:hypothetical protein